MCPFGLLEKNILAKSLQPLRYLSTTYRLTRQRAHATQSGSRRRILPHRVNRPSHLDWGGSRAIQATPSARHEGVPRLCAPVLHRSQALGRRATRPATHEGRMAKVHCAQEPQPEAGQDRNPGLAQAAGGDQRPDDRRHDLPSHGVRQAVYGRVSATGFATAATRQGSRIARLMDCARLAPRSLLRTAQRHISS